MDRAPLHHGGQQPPAEEKRKRSSKGCIGRGRSRGGCSPRAKVPTPALKSISSIFPSEGLSRSNSWKSTLSPDFLYWILFKELQNFYFAFFKIVHKNQSEVLGVWVVGYKSESVCGLNDSKGLFGFAFFSS